MVTCLVAVLAVAESRSVPSFSLKATDGQTWAQSSLVAKPTIAVFFAATCPHTLKSMPDWNRVAAKFAGKVRVVGFVNADLAGTKQLVQKSKSKLLLIADPGATTMRKFGAGHSLDFAYVSKKTGKVEGFWEGYSAGIMGEATGLAKSKDGVNPSFAGINLPETRQSGCSL